MRCPICLLNTAEQGVLAEHDSCHDAILSAVALPLWSKSDVSSLIDWISDTHSSDVTCGMQLSGQGRRQTAGSPCSSQTRCNSLHQLSQMKQKTMTPASFSHGMTS